MLRRSLSALIPDVACLWGLTPLLAHGIGKISRFLRQKIGICCIVLV